MCIGGITFIIMCIGRIVLCCVAIGMLVGSLDLCSQNVVCVGNLGYVESSRLHNYSNHLIDIFQTRQCIWIGYIRGIRALCAGFC